jgi:hypothetical protein
MESERTINRQRRLFIIALGTPRMPHARLPGGIIEASTATRVFSRKAADMTATKPWLLHTIGWLCPSFLLREGDMSNSRGIHVLEDVL